MHHEEPGGGAPPATPPAPSWLDNMLSGMGFPAPQAIVQELQRLNENLQPLSEFFSNIDPSQIQDLTDALREASNTGRTLLDKFK